MNNILNKKEKKIFDVSGEIDIKQYNDYVKTFKLTLWINFIFYSILFLIFVLILNTFDRGSIINVLEAYLPIIGVFLLIKLCKLKGEIQVRYQRLEKESNAKKYTMEFYSNYFIKRSNYIIVRVDYKDLKKIIETNHYFHLVDIENDNIIEKTALNTEQIEFVRGIRKDIYRSKIKSNIK